MAGHYGTIGESNAGNSCSKQSAPVQETDSLLSAHSHDVHEEADADHEVATRHLMAFYTSHALFMWNNRCYEFAAVLFTASAFPHTLVEASIRGLCAHLASVLFSPSLGRWLNRYAIRLWPVQGCIIVQRLCIALACLGWIPLMLGDTDSKRPREEGQTAPFIAAFALLVLIGMMERLSAVANLAIVEREWLPLLSTRKTSRMQDNTSDARGDELNSPARPEPCSNLHILNATTKRIDLITKLVAPLAVSRLVMSTDNIKAAGVVLAILQPVCGIFEIYFTQYIWRNCISGRAGRSNVQFDRRTESPGRTESYDEDGPSQKWKAKVKSLHFIKPLFGWLDSFASYLKNPVSLPSLAYVLEPFSVLTLAGSMTSYLLAAEFSLSEITMARTASTIVEISSTVLTPVLISGISKRSQDDSIRPLLVVGIAGLAWQLFCLLPVTAIFTIFPGLSGSAQDTKFTSITAMLFAGLAVSRLGPFAYSLVEQQIVQLKVPENQRIEFSSVETALFDVAELARWCMLMIFSSSKQFRWAALVSFASVVISFVMVLAWVRKKEDCAGQISQEGEENRHRQ